MKKKLVQYLSPALAVVLVVSLAVATACTSQPDDTTSETAPTNHPATAGQVAPTPIPVSVELVEKFAADQQAINEDWNKFHADFDRWRTGLTSCDRTAAQVALRGFASDFGEITEMARDIPGKGIARELPDNVIMAADMEEAALRLLRDDWQPGNPALLENAQTERSNAAALLRTTAIELDKLEEMDKPEDQELAKDFAGALEPVDEAWDTFYDSFAQLEDDHIDLTAAEIVTRLRVLVEEQETVLESLEDLPSDQVTDPVQDPLIEAAEAEAEALDDLLDAMRKAAKAESIGKDGDGAGKTGTENGDDGSGGNGAMQKSGSDGATAGAGENNGAPQGSSQAEVPGDIDPGHIPGESGPVFQGGVGSTPAFPPIPPIRATQTPEDAEMGSGSAGNEPSSTGDADEADYSPHFEAFEETLDESKTIRKKAERDLETIIEGVSEEDREALADFTRGYDDLIEEWDSFHSAFDRWVRTEGNCDRADAIDQLNQFSQRFSALGGRVRELSQVFYLRPSSDLMTEAVSREGAALRSLASTWAPFENDVYRGLDEERYNAARLRRLADLRTQEVMERNGVSQ